MPFRLDQFDSKNMQALNRWMQDIETRVEQVQKTSTKGVIAAANKSVDPMAPSIMSQGGRITSFTSPLHYNASTTSVGLYWDGTNGSDKLTIKRDDGTTSGPFPGTITATGLTANTAYYFYPYWDEVALRVSFVQGDIGPAHSTPSITALQQQNLRTRIPLANGAIKITTPSSGNTTGSGGTGGAGGGSAKGTTY